MRVQFYSKEIETRLKESNILSVADRQLLPFLTRLRKGRKRKTPRKKRPLATGCNATFYKSLSTARPWADSKAVPVHGDRATHLIKSCITAGAFTRGRSRSRSRS